MIFQEVWLDVRLEIGLWGERRISMWYLLARTEEVVITSLFCSAVFLGLSFAIVMLVKSVPGKLILLGVLLAVGAMLCGAFLTEMGALPLVMIALAAMIVLAGVLCIVIAFIAQTFKKPDGT